ncbi:hypothetical protein [Sphingomonas abaci]|uniref:Uncharacterized protein n=1 Tax=Sphingomonas abaci TaxID=237611 RepID=A0A7W7AIP2_9SPHN|nr:hypothetical protein [Sphingomonas abaci]MBB4616949.1 hypothetical protein [Sphingomonas abaci]
MESEKLKGCPFCNGPAVNVAGEYVTCGSPTFLDCAGRSVKAEPAAWNTRAPADLRSALEAETIERCARHLRERAKSFRKAAFDQGRRAGPMASSFEYAADEIEKSSAAIAALAPTTGDAS